MIVGLGVALATIPAASLPRGEQRFSLMTNTWDLQIKEPIPVSSLWSPIVEPYAPSSPLWTG